MAQDFDLELLRGRLRARRFGKARRACRPSAFPVSRPIRAHLTRLGERFERAGRSLIAFDLRGRGWSDITENGTYGWENHARDIFEAARALGIKQFDYVGHSMGAFIGMTATSLDRGKHIRRLVLIDGLGVALADGATAIIAGSRA